MALNDGDRPIKALCGRSQAKIAVFEDGVRAPVLRSDRRAYRSHPLIDGSSSMRDKMSIVHEAAVGFLRTLREGDRGAVVSFSDTVNVAQALTTDRALLHAAVKGTRALGATALNNALYIALKEFGRSAQQGPDVRRQAIALLSDGEDTSSLVSFDDVLALGRKSGVSVYTIRMQSEIATIRARGERNRSNFSESTYAMKTLAQDTGGQAFFPELVGDLKNIYAGISQELSSQYSIGYTPTNGRHDGRFRRIVVRLPMQPTLRPRARAGYTADADRSAALMSQAVQQAARLVEAPGMAAATCLVSWWVSVAVAILAATSQLSFTARRCRCRPLLRGLQYPDAQSPAGRADGVRTRVACAARGGAVVRP
jgi:Ca-activated chloride channel family protein